MEDMLPVMPLQQVQARIAQLTWDTRATGLFPDDQNIPRPPPIPEHIATRINMKRDKRNPLAQKEKDTKAYFNVLRELGEYVHEHNQKHIDNPKMHYRWYDATLSDKQRIETLMRIVEDLALTILGSKYGEETYDKLYRKLPHHLTLIILEAASDANFDPLTQGVRNYAIPKIVSAKMFSKRKAKIAAKKMEKERTRQLLITPATTNGCGKTGQTSTKDIALEIHSNCDMPSDFFNGPACTTVADLPNDIAVAVPEYNVNFALSPSEEPGESTARFVGRTPTAVTRQNDGSHYIHNKLGSRKPSVEIPVPDHYETRNKRNKGPLKMDIDRPGVTKARRRVARMKHVSKAPLSTFHEHLGSKHDQNVVYVHTEISATDAVSSRVRANPLVRGRMNKKENRKTGSQANTLDVAAIKVLELLKSYGYDGEGGAGDCKNIAKGRSTRDKSYGKNVAKEVQDKMQNIPPVSEPNALLVEFEAFQSWKAKEMRRAGEKRKKKSKVKRKASSSSATPKKKIRAPHSREEAECPNEGDEA